VTASRGSGIAVRQFKEAHPFAEANPGEIFMN